MFTLDPIWVSIAKSCNFVNVYLNYILSNVYKCANFSLIQFRGLIQRSCNLVKINYIIFVLSVSMIQFWAQVHGRRVLWPWGLQLQCQIYHNWMFTGRGRSYGPRKWRCFEGQLTSGKLVYLVAACVVEHIFTVYYYY